MKRLADKLTFFSLPFLGRLVNKWRKLDCWMETLLWLTN